MGSCTSSRCLGRVTYLEGVVKPRQVSVVAKTSLLVISSPLIRGLLEHLAYDLKRQWCTFHPANLGRVTICAVKIIRTELNPSIRTNGFFFRWKKWQMTRAIEPRQSAMLLTHVHSPAIGGRWRSGGKKTFTICERKTDRIWMGCWTRAQNR